MCIYAQRLTWCGVHVIHCVHGYSSEREDTVKADIFAAYRALLLRTKPSRKSQHVEGDNMEMSERYTHSPPMLGEVFRRKSLNN